MLLSLITVMLFAQTRYERPNALISGYEIQIGGLNDTELFDLKQLSAVSSEVEQYGAWLANFIVRNYTGNLNMEMSWPTVGAAAPFISRIKSWGYKISFYTSYAGDIRFPTRNIEERGSVPLLSYTWMLEKDSELVFLHPAPTNSPI